MNDYYQNTWGKALTRSARKYPGKIAVQDDQANLTYSQFDERTNRLANVLSSMGLLKGDRIATLCSNCIELMELYFAALKLGVVPCPLDARETVEGMFRLIDLVEPKAFAFHGDYVESASLIIDRLSEEIRVIGLGDGEDSPCPTVTDLIPSSSNAEPHVRLNEHDDAFILFTGGTTGTPKGVVLTHGNLIWNALNVISENLSPDPKARIYYPMQIYHSGALSRFLATIYAGGTFIGTRVFDPGLYLDTVEKQSCTFVVGNTAIWRMLLEENHRRPRNTSSITSWLHAQGDITVEFYEEIVSELFPGAAMYCSYALTEASPGVTVLKPHDKPRKWPGIGKPYISVEVRLVDEKNQDVEVGEVGEILVRGPNVTKGYFRNPEETAAAFSEDWLHTGDLGSADELGYLYFVDRIKDVIKSGGINIYAREVEAVLTGHPQVGDAAVIGVPHSKWGETVKAIVVLSESCAVSEQEIIDYCKARLASYKKPTSVVFVDEIPRGTFGSKILKKILREKYGQP